MKSVFRRLFFFLLLPVTSYLLLATIFPSPVHAQTFCAPPPPGSTDQQLINQMNKCFIEKSEFEDKAFNLNQTMGLTSSLSTLITGYSPATPAIAQIFQENNALASSGRMVASLYTNPPVSGVVYLAHKIQNLNPVKPAYAQPTTIGGSALQSITQIWTAFRNIAYVGFVIVFIVIGFMIMFRARVSPQTVATVQDSIPRIVIALILVTFSYAIVGLMIDFMFLILNVFLRGFEASGLITFSRAETAIYEHSIIGAVSKAWGEIVVTSGVAIDGLIKGVIQCGTICTLISWGAGSVLGTIGGLIVGIAALFMMFKIFFMLLMAYVSIIIYTIFAPFILLFQALPGNNGAFGWFKQVAANLSVFIVTALMLILAGILAGIGSFGGNPLAPAVTSTSLGQFPLLAGNIDTTAIARLIGLGFLFMIPSAANMIKERFKTGQGVAFGGPGAAALGASAGFMGRRVSTSAPVRAIGDLSEERSRRSTQNIVARAPGWAGGPGTPAGAVDITRRRVRS